MQLEDQLRIHREHPELTITRSIQGALGDTVLYVVAPELAALRRTGDEPRLRLFETATRRVVVGHSSDGTTRLLWVFSSQARAERWARGRAGLCAEPIPGPTAVGTALAAGSGIALDEHDGPFLVPLSELRRGVCGACRLATVDLASAFVAWSQRRVPRLLDEVQRAFRDSVLFVTTVDPSVGSVGERATTMKVAGRRLLLKRMRLGLVLEAQLSREHAFAATMPGFTVVPVDGPTLAGWAFEGAIDLRIEAGPERLGVLPFEELTVGWSRR